MLLLLYDVEAAAQREAAAAAAAPTTPKINIQNILQISRAGIGQIVMELKVWVEGIQRIVCGVTETTTCQVSFFLCFVSSSFNKL